MWKDNVTKKFHEKSINVNGNVQTNNIDSENGENESIFLEENEVYIPRENESIFLELPGIKTHPTLGDRAFQSAAPYLWNALPSAIRNMKTLDTFKTAIKTHLNKFNCWLFNYFLL